MSARDMIDLQISTFRGQAEDIDVPILGKTAGIADGTTIMQGDTVLACLELDTETTIGTIKDVSAKVDLERNGYIHVDTAPTSTAWKGLMFWIRESNPKQAFGQLCLKVKLVTGGAALASLTLTGIEVGDTILGAFHISTAASVSTVDDITHLVSIYAANTIRCTFDTSNDQIWVFYHDANGAGYDASNLRFALVDGTTVDTDIACADVNSNAIAVADAVIFCGHISTKATVATIADLTSECHATHTAGSIQMETTDTSNDLLFVIWQDVA
jgi:hypothetical protein